MSAEFGGMVVEGRSNLPVLYWLPKLHERPYKSRFIANSSSCITTELSMLFNSCLTAIKTHVLNNVKQLKRGIVKVFFWSIKIHG